MLFAASTHEYGALGHNPEKVRKSPRYAAFMKKLGVPEERFHARLLEFKALALKLRNPASPRDEGGRMIRAAEKRHPVLTQDDIYRIFQLEAAFDERTSYLGEPGSGDNWAWSTPMDEYATDMFMLMLTRVAIMETAKCARFECSFTQFRKRHAKHMTEDVKFRRKLLPD